MMKLKKLCIAVKRVSTQRAFHSVPIIDFSAFTAPDSSDYSAQKVIAKELHQACRDVGFFYAVGTGIDQVARKQKALALTRKFFDLPKDEKNKLHISSSLDQCRGYQALGQNITQEQRDQHEALDIFCELPPDHMLWKHQQPKIVHHDDIDEKDHVSNLLFAHNGANQWPSDEILPGFQHFFEKEYIPDMLNLGQGLLTAIAMSLNLPQNYFMPYFDHSFWILRLIHYPIVSDSTSTTSTKINKTKEITGKSTDELADGLGCGAHTDYGCLTFVLSDDMESLQIQNRDDEWIQAPTVPDSFVCNIGDMLEFWTGGLYRSTLHRVISTPQSRQQGRVSAPFFFEPNYDAEITPIDLLDFDNLSLKQKGNVDRIIYGKHLHSKTSNNFDY